MNFWGVYILMSLPPLIGFACSVQNISALFSPSFVIHHCALFTSTQGTFQHNFKNDFISLIKIIFGFCQFALCFKSLFTPLILLKADTLGTKVITFSRINQSTGIWLVMLIRLRRLCNFLHLACTVKGA